VAPLVSLVADGATQQLKATATLNNGEIEDQTAAATWTSSNPAVATVSNTTGSQGLVTGTGVGSAAITATAGSASNSATVLVESATQTVYPRFAYLGGSDDSITIYTVDAATGQLRPNGYVMEASGSHPYNLAVDPSSKFLFVANAGANSISAYTVNATNGALTPVAGSPFPAGNGPAGLAVDPTANFLYMANFSDGTVSAFTFDPNAGVLTAVSGSPFSVGGHPQYAAVDSGGKFLYIIDNENETVSGFTISPASGALTLITGSPYQMGGLPNGLTVDPSGQHLLVTMQPGLTGQNTGVSVFSINATSGALTLVPGSPFATGALNPSSIVVDPTDQYVYVAGNEGSVADFTLNSSNGVLTALPGTQPFLDYGQPSVLSVDPSGRFVYVTGYYSVTAFGLSPGSGVPIKLANFRTNQLSMSNLVITNGTAAVQSAPQLAYVANAGTTNGSPGSNNVWGFSIDPTAGGLSALGSSPVAEGYSPTAVTSDRLGQFLFVANNCSDPACSASAGSVSAYIINPATGSLTAAPGSPFLAGLNPVGVVVDPSERFVYVLNGSDQTISAYALNSATGSLSLVAGSPFPINVPNACYSALSPTATSLAMDPLGTGLLVGIGCGQFQYGYLTGAAISRYTGAVLSPSGPSSTLGDPLALLEEPTENYIYFGSDWYSTEEQTCRLPETPEGPACYPAGGQPSAIAVDATGRFLYVANATSDDISGYAIDPGGSGSLTPIPGSPFVAGTNPVSITVDVSGQYVYVVCRGDNDVWAYSIDQVSGTLTQTIGSPYPVGLLPVSITTTGKTQ